MSIDTISRKVADNKCEVKFKRKAASAINSVKLLAGLLGDLYGVRENNQDMHKNKMFSKTVFIAGTSINTVEFWYRHLQRSSVPLIYYISKMTQYCFERNRR